MRYRKLSQTVPSVSVVCRKTIERFTRRRFLQLAATASAAAANPFARRARAATAAAELPQGAAPPALALPHFPSRLHAFVWRNWPLVPVERMASVVGATAGQIASLGESMGLGQPPAIPSSQIRRSYITIIKRNWHLLPYDQLLPLLGWTPPQLDYVLREDDFLFVKLGSLKPQCAPLRWAPPDNAMTERARRIARIVREKFNGAPPASGDPLFGFLRELAAPPPAPPAAPAGAGRLRYCYSYFALYGDPLLESDLDPYPDGYLARLAACGVTGVWMQAVLHKLAPFPFQPGLSDRHLERLENLRSLAARARRKGIAVFLYLNEPRAMPLAFFETRPHLKGVVEGGYAALCTSHPDVQESIVAAVATICRAVPDLGGFFSISASENLTSCWSHGNGKGCPRCAGRAPAEVIAEVSRLFQRGIARAGGRQRLIAWDWGWQDAWAPDIIRGLPAESSLMSVSEWSLPIDRGGVSTAVGEYSISAVGPGPRASRHWALAQQRGLATLAKIQAGNTWELSAVPYIPAVANVARHAANLRRAGVKDIMLGWTLGGYPSPNLEVVAHIMNAPGDPEDPSLASQALDAVARRRFGDRYAPAVVSAWEAFSRAFSQFPFHVGVVYNAPLQSGPSNLLWAEPTRYTATMVGFPYDDLDRWRGPYPAETFIRQMDAVADGFDQAIAALRQAAGMPEGDPPHPPAAGEPPETRALESEIGVAAAASIHWRSVANQSRFVLARQALARSKSASDARPHLDELERLLRAELALARRLHILQCRDSRLGFEASNQYYYVPADLVEKAINCDYLLEEWLPACRQQRG